jgi:hypothetical protein
MQPASASAGGLHSSAEDALLQRPFLGCGGCGSRPRRGRPGGRAAGRQFDDLLRRRLLHRFHLKIGLLAFDHVASASAGALCL